MDTAATSAGSPPRHFADQREIYERYGFIDMRREPDRYKADAEPVEALTYPTP